MSFLQCFFQSYFSNLLSLGISCLPHSWQLLSLPVLFSTFHWQQYRAVTQTKVELQRQENQTQCCGAKQCLEDAAIDCLRLPALPSRRNSWSHRTLFKSTSAPFSFLLYVHLVLSEHIPLQHQRWQLYWFLLFWRQTVVFCCFLWSYLKEHADRLEDSSSLLLNPLIISLGMKFLKSGMLWVPWRIT